MTLLDAPEFNYTRDRRRRGALIGTVSAVFVLLVAWWLVAGRPIDFPWNWNAHLFGRSAMNTFLADVEKNDLPTAYGVWTHDKNWQQHADQHSIYPFDRFRKDWSPTSPDNEYGVIKTHKIVAARKYGNVLLAAILINGRKSGALSLTYDPKTHSLDFAPPGEEIDPESYAK